MPMNDNELINEELYRHTRLAYIEEQKMIGRNMYPHIFKPTMSIDSYIKKYQNIDNGSHLTYITHSISGRITLKREAGKLVFYTIENDGYEVQLLSSLGFLDIRKDIDEKDKLNIFKDIHKEICRGDIVGTTGFVGKSKKGELSLFVTSITLLVPCVRYIPKKSINCLKDIETRFRNRSLDFIVNIDRRVIIKTRASILRELRRYLDSNDMIEVSTPIVWNQAGGASAKPFKTKINALNMDAYLRVAPELFLKQLIVGGFPGVYEIGQQFRNESIDSTHNPEFTSLEFYKSYTDYNDLMTMVEEFIPLIVKYINKGSLIVEYVMDNELVKIDFTPPYRRIDIMEELKNKIGLNISNFFSDETRLFLIDELKKLNIKCPEPHTTARILDRLVGEYIEAQCIEPTFIINHPRIMSPLAKLHRNDPSLTERFELFILKMEVANAFTELNDPVVQNQNFEAQMQDRVLGDIEAQTTDKVFINALEYGLPPTAGFGMGIDRLVMLLTKQISIREVLTFRYLELDILLYLNIIV